MGPCLVRSQGALKSCRIVSWVARIQGHHGTLMPRLLADPRPLIPGCRGRLLPRGPSSWRYLGSNRAREHWSRACCKTRKPRSLDIQQTRSHQCQGPDVSKPTGMTWYLHLIDRLGSSSRWVARQAWSFVSIGRSTTRLPISTIHQLSPSGTGIEPHAFPRRQRHLDSCTSLVPSGLPLQGRQGPFNGSRPRRPDNLGTKVPRAY
jgi:hypothetical protein